MNLRGPIMRYVRGLRPRSAWDLAPGLATLRRYDRAWLRPDLVSGLTVGAVCVPAALAMAELAGLPVVYGLYGTFLPLAVYGLLATSRQHVIGPDATLATMTAVTIAPLATVGGAVDPALYLALASSLALAMGLLLLFAGTLRLGFVADFFGKPVLLGYINGVAITVIATQIGKLFGISVSNRDFIPMIQEIASDFDQRNGPTVVLSVVLLALAVVVRRYFTYLPAALVVLVAALAIAAVVDLPAHGISVVGEVPGGLPSLGLPDVGISRFIDLLLPAVGLSLIAFADMIATVRLFARKHGYETDANRELSALGAANLTGGFMSAFPVSSSNSRSAVNDATGARSQGAVIVAAIVVGAFLLFAMPLIEPLPSAALGVIIVISAAGLIDFRPIWELRHVRPAEVGLAVAAAVGVLLFGVLGGVGTAVALSVGMFLYRSARPHDAVLGEVSDVDGFHDIDDRSDARTTPGLVVYRFDAALFFANAEYFRQRVEALVDADPPPEWFVVNAEAWVYLDATAVEAIEKVHADLADRGVTLSFARLKSRQREIFRDTGLTDVIGAERIFPTVRAAVAAFHAR